MCLLRWGRWCKGATCFLLFLMGVGAGGGLGSGCWWWRGGRSVTLSFFRGNFFNLLAALTLALALALVIYRSTTKLLQVIVRFK